MGRHYTKLCDLPDFEDPELRAMLRELMPGLQPTEELHRKYWEWAMLGLFLEESGVLTESAAALSIAAGHEPPLYWLANRIGRVVATDIYGEGGFSGREAEASMLSDAAVFAPFPYRQDHLEVRHMDALTLEFSDESFDIVFCMSSIEHFGGPDQTVRAANEMGRVLRPGGALVITTECLVGRHPLDPPLVQYAIRLATFGRRAATATPRRRAIEVYSAAEIRRDIVQPLAAQGVMLHQPLDVTMSPSTRENMQRWVGDGELHPATGHPFPHILLKGAGSPWTSAFLGFRKQA